MRCIKDGPGLERQTIGLGMIVKNGAQTLRRCLASLAGAVDTIVIGDTGSTDDTSAIAIDCGAEVIAVEWTNDFAQARNAVLDHLQTDWVLSLDADEELTADAAASIRKHIEHPGMDAYRIDVRNYLSPALPPMSDQVALAPGEQHPHAPDAPAYFPSVGLRLFRKDPRVFYRGCVHEIIDHQVIDLGLTVGAGDFIIHHMGWYLVDARRAAEKRALYCELLRRKLEAMPGDTNTLVRYAAFLHEDQGKTEEALELLQRAVNIDGTTPGAWLLISMIYRKQGLYEPLLDAVERIPPEDAPILKYHLKGDGLYHLGMLSKACDAYEQAHALAPYDRAVNCKLGRTEIRLGRVEAGLHRMEGAANMEPAMQGVDEMLIAGYFAANRTDDALDATEKFARKYASAEAWLGLAHMHAQCGNWEVALSKLDSAVAMLPEEVNIHALRMKAALALNDLPKASVAACRVAELAPSPKNFLRLAAIHARDGRSTEAEAAMLRGATLFPDASEFQSVAVPC